MDTDRQQALALIFQEMDKQDSMWGPMNERADISNNQLQHAGMAQLDALFDRQNGEPDAFDSAPEIYPQDWSGFRNYGSDVANKVVAVAFLIQSIKHDILQGKDTTRLARQPDQVYAADAPLVPSQS